MQRIYIDTSVAGGYFDEIFSDESRMFFKMVRNGEIAIIISSLVDDELMEAPAEVSNLIANLPESFIEKAELTNEAMQLAEKYIKEKVVGKTSIEDCRHIAMATLLNADILVSWNFKHIVNVKRIN